MIWGNVLIATYIMYVKSAYKAIEVVFGWDVDVRVSYPFINIWTVSYFNMETTICEIGLMDEFNK